MKHPSRETLALHSGGDLGWPARWITNRHLSGCGDCRDEVAAFAEVRAVLPELNRMPEVPWNRIAAEMRANIHLGLSAGECVRMGDTRLPSERPSGSVRLFPGFNGARVIMALGGVCALLVIGLILERPHPVSAAEPMVQATGNGIQRRSGDRAFGLMHSGAQNVTYSVGAQGTLGARYVDPETGVMTMTKVYVE